MENRQWPMPKKKCSINIERWLAKPSKSKSNQNKNLHLNGYGVDSHKSAS